MKFIEFKRGFRRNVILVGKYAIKIPRPFISWPVLLYAIIENLNERYWWVTDGGEQSDMSMYPFLTRVYWGDRKGFILISERVIPATDKDKFYSDLDIFLEKYKKTSYIFVDRKMENFGYRGNELVCLDYGYFQALAPCYLGCKAKKHNRLQCEYKQSLKKE